MTVKIYTIASEVLSTELSKEELLSKVVLLSDYEELQRKVEAMAVETQIIREQSEDVYAAGYNQGHLNTVDGIAYTPPVKDEFYERALQVMAEAETPATDAALAEKSNEAVNGFITFLKQRAREFPQSVVAESLDVIIVNAEQYSHSQQLRKESGQ